MLSRSFSALYVFIQELINCVFPCQYGQICGNSSVARLKLSSQMMKTPPKTTKDKMTRGKHYYKWYYTVSCSWQHSSHKETQKLCCVLYQRRPEQEDPNCANLLWQCLVEHHEDQTLFADGQDVNKQNIVKNYVNKNISYKIWKDYPGIAALVFISCYLP